MLYKYYRTIAIELSDILVDKNDNINPYAEDVIIKLIDNNFNLIIWSDKGIDYCKKYFSDQTDIIFLEKNSKEMNIFFCIDTDLNFISKFRLSSLVNFMANSKSGEVLQNVVDKYIEYVDFIEEKIFEK